MLFSIFVFLILVSDFYLVRAESRTNFDVKRVEKCFTNGTVKYSFNITKLKYQQFLDFHMMSSIALDDNIGMITNIETALDKHTFVPLFTIREKDFCKAMNKYLGEFWYDIERAAQVPAGACPIRAGNYHVRHLLIHFEKIALQTFPFGTLRFTIRGIDKKYYAVEFCVILEVENLIN